MLINQTCRDYGVILEILTNKHNDRVQFLRFNDELASKRHPTCHCVDTNELKFLNSNNSVNFTPSPVIL